MLQFPKERKKKKDACPVPVAPTPQHNKVPEAINFMQKTGSFIFKL